MKEKQLYGSESLLTLEEMLDFVESKLSKAENERVESIISGHPLYREAIESLRDEYANDPDFRSTALLYENIFDEYVSQEAKAIDSSSAKTTIEDDRSNFLNTLINKIESSFHIPRRRQPALAFVLALLLLSVIGYVILLPLLSSTGDAELYAQYMEHYVDPLASLSDEEQAIKFYHQQKYQEAIPLFEQIIGKGTNLESQNKIKMLLSVSLMRSKREIEALPYLQEIIDHGKSMYVIAAKWYLALVYLSQKKRSQAVKLLTEISNLSNLGKHDLYYKNQALELLDKIR